MPTPSLSRTALITLVRQQAETIARLEADNQRLRAANDSLREQLEVLHYRVSQMSRRIYGNTSERFIDTGQQIIPGVVPAHRAVPDDEVERCALVQTSTAAQAAPPTRRARRGRLALPGHLPREDRVIAPDPQTLSQPSGQRLVKLRDEVTEKLDYIAGGFRVIRFIRPVYGVPHGDGMTVCAPPPPHVVARGLPTDRLVVQVLCEKFDLHNPLYRQQQRFQRAGIDLPRSTLANWIGAAVRMLTPVVDAMITTLRSSPVLGMDDTVIDRLAPGLGRTHTGRFWGYTTSTTCVIQYADTRAGAHPQDFLAGWSGAIVADAYSGHEALYRTGDRIHVPCMVHVRRKFSDALKLANDTRAKPALVLIRSLYRLEKHIRDQPPDVIAARRQRDAIPILTQLHHCVQTLASQATPKSPLGMACAYVLTLWPRLHRYTTDGRYPIDNNAIERLWKPVALGRKNYLFVGNELGGERAAAAYTIVLSCRLNNIDPYHYLCDVFAELHAGKRTPDELTPAAWAKRNATVTDRVA